MLVIRLARSGRSKYPTYRIVAAESARAATGKFVEVLGHYNPHTKELSLKRDEIASRLEHGAQPSNTVIKLLQREKVELPAWVTLKTKAPKPVEAVVEEVAEAPAQADEAESAEVADEITPEVAEEAAETSVEAASEEVAAEPTDEVRVGEVVEDVATEAEAEVPNIDDTETAAKDEERVEAAEAAQDDAADAATKA